MAHKKRKKSKIGWAMQALTSAISTTLLLILLGLVILFSLTARVVADSVKENLTVTAVLDDDVQTQEAVRLLDSLKTMRYVSDIEYISREQAFQEQIESMGIDPTEFLGANPFSISMEIRMKPEFSCNDSLEWIAGELESSKLVADVVYQKILGLGVAVTDSKTVSKKFIKAVKSEPSGGSTNVFVKKADPIAMTCYVAIVLAFIPFTWIFDIVMILIRGTVWRYTAA